jgi:hypothetical protein
MTNHRGWLRRCGVWLLLVAILFALYPLSVQADDSGDGFNIQVAPSPLVVTLTPGQRHIAAITVRNLSAHSETIKPSLSGFTVSANGDKIDLNTDVPLGLRDWVSFAQSSLTIPAGASRPLEVVYNTPSNVGFSYSVAVTLSQAKKGGAQGATLKGSVAVFNLININRADAKRELSIRGFAGDKSRYEYLPADFALTVKNSGNVIDQPAGNIFIQRSFNDTEPITVIPINKTGNYVLPGTTRTLHAVWSDGFPAYVERNSTGETAAQKDLSWDWRQLNRLRIGKYVAKVVLVYNDGQRDVPLVASYSFWVIPWKLIITALLVLALVLTGIIAWVRLALKGTNKVRKYAHRR